MYPSEPFPHFVDDYLAYLQEAHPTHASLDGVHLHDDLLDDLSRGALDSHVRALAGFGRRLSQIDPAHLSPSERVDHAIVTANVEARVHDVEVDADLGPQPPALRGAARHQPGVAGAVRLRARARARPADGVEAAPGAALRPGRDRQHQGGPRHLRQDRRSKPGAACCRSSRRTCRGRSRASTICTSWATWPTRPPTPSAAVSHYVAVPRERSGTARQGVVPAGARALRAEAEARRGDRAQRRRSCWASPCAR